VTEETERVEASEAGADAPAVTPAAETSPDPEGVLDAVEAPSLFRDHAEQDLAAATPAESAEASADESSPEPDEVGDEASAVAEQAVGNASEQSEEPGAAPDTEEADDLEAAIEQAGANFDEEPVAHAAPESDAEEAPEADAGDALAAEVRPKPVVSWIPFLIYDLVWLVFAGLLVWQFIDLEVGKAIYHSPLYPAGLLGGLVLLMAGPVLVLGVWMASWRRENVRKGTTFVAALFRGSVAILVGMVIWWGALLLLDQLRLGALL
jgi:hypothetical protein